MSALPPPAVLLTLLLPLLLSHRLLFMLSYTARMVLGCSSLHVHLLEAAKTPHTPV